jgi:hypothetical protein
MKKRFKIILVFAVLCVLYHCYSKANFEFDEAIHYSLTDDKTEKIPFDDSLVFGNFPYAISDTLFIAKLEKKGFVKKQIDKSRNEQLKSILTSDFGITIGTKKCEVVYRDIIVLKTNNKITGIAKICFGCGEHHFIGRNFNEYNFDKYDDLEKLLYSK